MKFVKRADIMLSVLATHKKGKKQRDMRELWEVIVMSIIDCGDGMGVCVCPNSSNCTHYICAGFCNPGYLNKAVKNNKSNNTLRVK